VALANKVARIIYVLMRGRPVRRPAGRGLTIAGGLGKRNSRRKARLEIEGADEVSEPTEKAWKPE
jgi:hypothetical protein